MSHLPMPARRTIIGHEHTGRLAYELCIPFIQRRQGGQIDIQMKLVVERKEIRLRAQNIIPNHSKQLYEKYRAHFLQST